MGGGLGHLARSTAVIHTLGIAGHTILLSASRFADEPRITAGIRVIRAPQIYIGGLDSYRLWLRKLFDELKPDELYLDTFPAGIRGELCNFSPLLGMPIYHVARLLKWDEYKKLLLAEPPRLTEAYILESLDTRHARFIKQQGATEFPLALQYPPAPGIDYPLRQLIAGLKRNGRPVWLVVHSGPAQEVSTLLSYAEKMRDAEDVPAQLVLLAQRPPDRLPECVVTVMNSYPAFPVFSLVDRVISGCGFNIMRQMEPFREKHRFIPFSRRFDDQFKRASQVDDTCFVS